MKKKARERVKDFERVETDRERGENYLFFYHTSEDGIGRAFLL